LESSRNGQKRGGLSALADGPMVAWPIADRNPISFAKVGG
jgi:hypothetical protein